MTRGDIYYVFPGSQVEVGSEQRSGRPALIVSNDSFNSHSNSITVVYITGQDKPPMDTHVVVPDGLPVYGTILCEQLATVDVHRVGRYMCHYPDMTAVDRALKVQLSLGSDIASVVEPVASEPASELSYKILYYELLDKILKGRS